MTATFVPSENQHRIFNFIRFERGSAIINAVAGSGKSTTIVKAAELLHPSVSATFVAFNKTIAEELKAKLPKHIPAKTLNGLGHGAWMRGRKLEVDSGKTRRLLKEIILREEDAAYVGPTVKLVSLAKSIGLVPRDAAKSVRLVLTADSDAAWEDLLDHHDIILDDAVNKFRLFDFARIALKKSIETAEYLIDFDDQLYMPVIMGSGFYRVDMLFVDEAQDVNLVQRTMLKMALKPNGRLIAVGDPAQAIYGFRGADSESLENIRLEFRAQELPLSVSYRCAKAIVREAQRYAPHIQPSPTAPEGVVRHDIEAFGPSLFTRTDGILCRNTAPLVKLAFQLLRYRTPCRVLGRDIGQGLIQFILKMRSKNIDTLLTRMQDYLDRESEALRLKGKESEIDAIQDRVDTVRMFVDELPENKRTIAELKAVIESLFSDDKGAGILTLCTIHKSKGLEWERVFILDWELLPSPRARQPWQQKQERNLQYVAVTRAKRELGFIIGDYFTPPVKTTPTQQELYA